MAKEFKDFDRKYAHLQCSIIEDIPQHYIGNLAKALTGWRFTDELLIWAPSEIRKAVYESATADAWQQFRVSLKGYETRIKLARLEIRYLQIHEPIKAAIDELYDAHQNIHLLPYDPNIPEEALLEKCRIDNYIYALRRGGLLDEQFRISR